MEPHIVRQPSASAAAVCKAYSTALENPMITRDAAAIQALIGIIRSSNASTMMGLREVLREAGEALGRQHDAPLSIASLCELFVRFVTRTALASAEVDFDAMRRLLLERGETLARTTLEARSKIARVGAAFIDAGGVVLTLEV